MHKLEYGTDLISLFVFNISNVLVSFKTNPRTVKYPIIYVAIRDLDIYLFKLNNSIYSNDVNK